MAIISHLCRSVLYYRGVDGIHPVLGIRGMYIMLTIVEMKEKLVEQVDEVTLIDWLEVNAEDIVNAFEDRVVANYDKLLGELE
jgi:hypothetical protein|tara:strand:- start:1738 stop:1986 length:249 start_codon:yes stop_codon:yes gene_type:complete